MWRARRKRLCDVVSSPDRHQVIAAYGRAGGFRTHLSVAWRAFVFSFYRLMLFKQFRSVEPPYVCCLGAEKHLLLVFWAVPFAIVILLLGGSLFTLGVWGFAMLGLSLMIYRSDRNLISAKARTRKNLCRSCGYDLSGLPSTGKVEVDGAEYDLGCATCPECGSEYPRVCP